MVCFRQATQKQSQDCEGHGKDEKRFQGEEEIVGCGFVILLISRGVGHHGPILCSCDRHDRLSAIFWPQRIQSVSSD